MARARERLFTIEDWLAYEGEPDRLYELIDGRLVAMNLPKAWHGDIAIQLAGLCRDALQGRFPCRVRSQAGIEITREPRAKAYIADLAVTCEPFDVNRPLMPQMVALGACFVLLGTLNSALYATLAAQVRRFIHSYRARKIINRATGGVLIAMGGMMGLAKRAA